MANNSFYYIFILLTVFTNNSYEVKLIRRIEAIGMPYYKISMRLGSCKEHIIYTEHRAWPVVKLNRILDIYYKNNFEYTVSSVVIELVVNNTDCLGFSKYGVGRTEFSATLFFATDMAPMFYSLTLFTCSRNFNPVFKQHPIVSQLPFYTLRRKFVD